MTPRKEQREIVFRQAGQPDQVVPLITPYIELPARIDRDGRTWAYAEQEDCPILRPTDEINLDADRPGLHRRRPGPGSRRARRRAAARDRACRARPRRPGST